jgi:putative dTDP-4-keto-6-deoxyglucose-3, 5-epimerase and dTDP-6-deoxy-L-mannose-dehydrogenase
MTDYTSTLIIGANGQLAKAMQQQYPSARAVGHNDLNLCDAAAIATFDWSGIKTIINTAAYTNVDGAETSEGRAAAWRINAQAVGQLARICSEQDITLVHVSSDYVFDGETAPHTEDEPLSPLSVYGASKAAGDIAASTTPRHYIIRTSWVIGDGKNFVTTMLGLAAKNIAPTVVADQIGRLSFTPEIARAIDHLVENKAPYGTYNVTNSGPLASWADITRQIFALAGRDDLTVTDTTTAEYFANKPGIAPRPLNSDLSLEKLHATGFASQDWQDALHEYVVRSIH